ncbi:MAG: hypothetical protein V3V67_05655 [Myxococcota bacterium]
MSVSSLCAFVSLVLSTSLGFASQVRASDEGVVPVEYFEMEKEIHGLSLERNRLEFYRRLERFLDEHLASREAADAGLEAQAELSRCLTPPGVDFPMPDS